MLDWQISISGLFWKKWTQCDHPDCYQQQVQKPGPVMVWGCVSALGKGNLHFCDGTIYAQRYIEILEQHMLPSRRQPFQGRPFQGRIFQQEDAKPHSTHISKAWLRRKIVQGLEWPVCSPDVPNIECVVHFWDAKGDNEDPVPLHTLSLQEESDKVTPETLHHLVSTVPKQL